MSANEQDQAGELLIQEVDDELRHEYYRRLWQRYGNWVIAAAILIIALVAGTQAWQNWQARRQHESAEAFAKASNLVVAGDVKGALASLSDLAGHGTEGFALAARMRAADLLVRQGDVAGALAIFEQIAGSGAPKLYRDLAVLKAGLLAVDGKDWPAWQPRIAALAVEGDAWRAPAEEVLALAALKAGDKAKATQIFKQLSDDVNAPQGLRARAAEMLAVETPEADGAAKTENKTKP